VNQAMSPMDVIGTLPDGRTLYYAGEHFTEPGFYVPDPDGPDGHQRVELIPARGTPAGQAQATPGDTDLALAIAEIAEDPERFLELVKIRIQAAPANGRDHFLIRLDFD
jgi:hypothetical protein